MTCRLRWLAPLLALSAVTAAGTAQAESVGAIPAPNAAELKAFEAATRARYEIKRKAFAEGKWEVIANEFYAPNAFSFGPDGATNDGRAQILRMYQKEGQVADVDVNVIRSYVNGNAGWQWANFVIKPKAHPDQPVTLSILFLWTKVAGKWVCAGDSYGNGSFHHG